MTKDEKEHTALSWWIIERKVAYYKPEHVHPSHGDTYTTSDDEYDAAEVRYLELCRKLKLPNSVVHKPWTGFEELVTEHSMMEVDETRPSVQLVIKKLSSPKRR